MQAAGPKSNHLQIMKEDDSNWPPPDRVGRQELEVVMGNEHISFATTKLGSLLQVGFHRGLKEMEGAAGLLAVGQGTNME